MHKKLTITLDEQLYDGLHRVIGRGKISQFIEDLLRPHILSTELDAEYKKMAKNAAREREAEEWCEGVLGGDRNEPW
ncbi:MAG: addiction module antitoxin [Candidatus Riflebacteria bacterium]|nr:addiction module antitoxin [Candidatus Riflebacteria bacterium]